MAASATPAGAPLEQLLLDALNLFRK